MSDLKDFITRQTIEDGTKVVGFYIKNNFNSSILQQDKNARGFYPNHLYQLVSLPLYGELEYSEKIKYDSGSNISKGLLKELVGEKSWDLTQLSINRGFYKKCKTDNSKTEYNKFSLMITKKENFTELIGELFNKSQFDSFYSQYLDVLKDLVKINASYNKNLSTSPVDNSEIRLYRKVLSLNYKDRDIGTDIMVDLSDRFKSFSYMDGDLGSNTELKDSVQKELIKCVDIVLMDGLVTAEVENYLKKLLLEVCKTYDFYEKLVSIGGQFKPNVLSSSELGDNSQFGYMELIIKRTLEEHVGQLKDDLEYSDEGDIILNKSFEKLDGIDRLIDSYRDKLVNACKVNPDFYLKVLAKKEAEQIKKIVDKKSANSGKNVKLKKI